MLALGIDPGTALCGFGFVRARDDDMELVAFGAISTPKTDPLPLRLRQIHSELSDLIAEYQPSQVAVEKLFFSKNTRTALAVGQARGVALLAAAQSDLPIYEYTPNEVKLAIAGYGGADKRQMQLMVQTLLRLDAVPEPDDAADALAIAICHLQSARLRELIASQNPS